MQLKQRIAALTTGATRPHNNQPPQLPSYSYWPQVIYPFGKLGVMLTIPVDDFLLSWGITEETSFLETLQSIGMFHIS